MKKIFAIALLGSLVQSVAFGAQGRPVLVKKVGGLANYGVVKTCEILSDNASLNQEFANLESVLAEATQGELETVALFNRAQVPSEEVYALVMKDGVATKVDLSVVYSRMSARNNPSAQALTAFVESACE